MSSEIEKYIEGYIEKYIISKQLCAVGESQVMTELDAQQASLDQLTQKRNTIIRRFDSQEDQSFPQLRMLYLHTYDALFRVIEIQLLQRYHVKLAHKPHRTMQDLLWMLFPTTHQTYTNEIMSMIVRTRHQAKKQRQMPLLSTYHLLLSLYDTCRQSVA